MLDNAIRNFTLPMQGVPENNEIKGLTIKQLSNGDLEIAIYLDVLVSDLKKHKPTPTGVHRLRSRLRVSPSKTGGYTHMIPLVKSASTLTEDQKLFIYAAKLNREPQPDELEQ